MSNNLLGNSNFGVRGCPLGNTGLLILQYVFQKYMVFFMTVVQGGGVFFEMLEEQ